MKNLKNLTIASTLCVSACMTSPTLTNAMMKSGKPSPISTTFMTKRDYIKFTNTSKKAPGPFVGSRLLMYGDNCAYTSNHSSQPLPSTTLKKQVRFWDSSSSTSSKTSKNTVTQSKLHSNFKTKKDYMDFTGTGKKTLGSHIQSRINMLSNKTRSNKTTSKPIITQTDVKKHVSFFESLNSKSSSSLSKKSVSTQTPNTSDASTQTKITLNKSTQTDHQVSKSNVSKLRKLFGN